MQIIPINEAEAILDPLWDTAQSELNQWTIESGASHGLAVRQSWDKVVYEWVRRPDKGPALRMSRRCEVACDDYDRLVLSVMAPEAAVIRLMASTDRGECRTEAKQSGPKKQEIAMDLAGEYAMQGVVGKLRTLFNDSKRPAASRALALCEDAASSLHKYAPADVIAGGYVGFDLEVVRVGGRAGCAFVAADAPKRQYNYFIALDTPAAAAAVSAEAMRRRGEVAAAVATTTGAKSLSVAELTPFLNACVLTAT
jgi:hypothetical protein